MRLRFCTSVPGLAIAFFASLILCLYLGRSGGAPLPVANPSLKATKTRLVKPSSHDKIAQRISPPLVSPVAADLKPLPPPTVSKTDPVLSAMQSAMRFAARVRAARDLSVGRQITEGRRLLKARSGEDRALGGILLFFNGELDWEVSDAIAKDTNLLVPLAVLDWIRDFGSDEQVVTFSQALAAREIPEEELTAYLTSSASSIAGGRSALELLLRRQDEETVADALEPVILASGASYDVREQALFKILEPENKQTGLELLDQLASNEENGESLLAQSLAKWKELAHLSDPDDEEVPYKVWDTPLRELTNLAENDLGLAVRTMANYLEYGLRRDDPDFEPVVEEGAYEVAKAFLDRANATRDALLSEEADALDRLSVSIERLVSYDPAFVTDENEFDPDFDEEIDVEILDAEDAYLADLLAEDDVGDDEVEEEDEDPPGVSDEDDTEEEESDGDEDADDDRDEDTEDEEAETGDEDADDEEDLEGEDAGDDEDAEEEDADETDSADGEAQP